MDRVPAEIWHEIFIKLDLKDRLKCLPVCRSWYATLDSCSLLYDLNITTRQYHKLKDVMEILPYRAAQTEYLTFQNNLERNFDKRELINMFPNLRELILKKSFYGMSEIDTSRPFHFINSAIKLERIEEYGKCELTRQLVMSNLCNNVKSLELNLRGTNSFVSITKMKNMPVLEHLGLTRSRVTLMDLNKLHQNLPALKSLDLKVHLISGQVPRDVLPATLITELKVTIDSAEDVGAHIQFYKYLAKKYFYVTNPTFQDSAIMYQNMPYVRDVYNEGIFPIYQRIGYQYDTWTFDDYYNELNAFRKFDVFGMKLKELTIDSCREDAVLSLGDLAQSQQSKSIKKLTLKDIIPEPIYLMKNMKALTTLEISARYRNDDLYDEEVVQFIDFSQLVEACPAALTTLRLSGHYLTFDESTSNQTSIECLDLSSVSLELPLAKIIETSFPQLVHLRLDGDIQYVITLSLPKHNLTFVDIRVNFLQAVLYGIGYVVTTADDNKIEYYDEKERPCNSNDSTCIARENLGVSPVLSLSCASLDELSLHVDD